jgi:hypothetical protein
MSEEELFAHFNEEDEEDDEREAASKEAPKTTRGRLHSRSTCLQRKAWELRFAMSS